MAKLSVVVVYGLRHGGARSRWLGTGSLALSRLVLVDATLGKQLASLRPPVPQRVAIGTVVDGQAQVEIVEVAKTMKSEPLGHEPTQWGLDLVEPAKAPADTFGAATPEHGPAVPQGLWCVLFPRASFCRH